MQNKTNGTVKWFNAEKGYGFITYNGGEAFAHFSAIQAEGYKALDANDNVEFVVENSDRGPVAKQIRKI